MRLFVVLMGLCVGCATSSTTQRTTNTTHQDELGARVDGLIGEFHEAGLVHKSTKRRFLATGDTHAYEYTVAADSCGTWAVRAAGQLEDVDAAVYLASGRQLQEDAEPDAEPVLQWCTERQARVFVRIHAFAGAGEVALVHWNSAEPVPMVRDVAGREIRVEAHRGDDPTLNAVEARGFRRMGAPLEFSLAQTAGMDRAVVSVPTLSPSGSCQTVLVWSEQPASLRVVRGRTELARETASAVESSEGHATGAQWCNQSDQEEAEVLVSGVPGSRVFVHLFSATQERVGGVAGLWLGRRPPQ